MSWGSLRLGKVLTREGYTLGETPALGGSPVLTISGQDAAPQTGMTDADVRARQTDIVGLLGTYIPVTFEFKTEHNGYYRVASVDTAKVSWPSEAVGASWTVGLERVGPENAVDLESRLSQVVRANDFALTGTRWHSPPIGHYGYYTGTTNPSGTVSRAGAYGTQLTYLGVPANVNPRWGATTAAFIVGRVIMTRSGVERASGRFPMEPTGWVLDNGLVRISPLTSNGQLFIESYDGSAWEGKNWHIAKGGATTSLGSFDSAEVIANKFHIVTIRLMRNAAPGRTFVDVTLRRGARFAEISLQTNASTTLGAYLNTNEAATDGTASGYIVATADDASGNKYAAGSPRSVTFNANGGISKAAVTALDLWIGSVVGGAGAASGDAATDLRDQYIGAMPETLGVSAR